VLSNTIWPRAQHEAWFARDGVLELIDGAVYSSEIAWAKPHPEAFRAAAAAVGTEPERVLFVGDRPFEDIHGAAQVGMRTALVPFTVIGDHERGPVQGEADAVLDRLLDVLDVVDRWT
jgi:putative hydrolase of the HAD superfamily